MPCANWGNAQIFAQHAPLIKKSACDTTLLSSLTMFWYLTKLLLTNCAAAGVSDAAPKKLLLLISDFAVTGSREYRVELVEPSRKATLPAACLGPGHEDKSLIAMSEKGGYPMFLLEFSYTPKRFCISRVDQQLLFFDGSELGRKKIPSDPPEVEVRNKNSIS